MALFRRRPDDTPLPAHPFRDSALVYAGMGGVIVVVATLTGGSPARGFGAAVIFFVIATAWTWWGYRKRIQAREAAAAAAAAAGRRANGNGRGGTG